MSSYRALAEYYDRFMTTDYDARADYMLAVFRAHGQTPHTLLDLACGSGSLTAALTARGIDTVGVDSSQDMLSVAMQKCPEALLLCQDMRQLDLYDVVDGAVCTLDSFNHLIRTKDVAAVLERLRLFIAPQGLLVFDVNTPFKHRCVLSDNTFVFEDETALCVWQNRLTERTCTVHMFLDFFEEDEDGRYVRTGDEVVERAYSLKTWQKLLKDSGFSFVAAYEDMTFSPAEDKNERWVIVAQNTRPAEDYSA